jgi:hypothetical protein
MSLPAPLLLGVEHHACFSGCYLSALEGQVCLDPAQPLEPVVVVSCQDCLSFKIGVRRALLPPATPPHRLADQLTQYVRQLRGYGLSFAGYHPRGPGFWLSAAYYGRGGLFLLDGERSRALGSDLDLLVLAFRHGVAAPPDPRMLDPRQYATQVIYVNYAPPLGPVACRQDLLSSPQCRLQPQRGFQRVTLAEFLPLARQAAPAPAAGPPARRPGPVPAAARSLKPGDICPICHAEVRERPLLHGTYVGCLC